MRRAAVLHFCRHNTSTLKTQRSFAIKKLIHILFCAVVATLGVTMLLIKIRPAASFDRAIWMASGEWQPYAMNYPRRQMVDYLVGSNVLARKSRAEVEAMLGSPSRTDKFREADLVYWIGPDRGMFGIDSEWLLITFDSSDVVNNYFITED